MKQVLFILLVFISFNGFSQESVKLKQLGLEVRKTDLSKMTWDEAKKACGNLGDGWRLPTIQELSEKIYPLRNEIGGFTSGSYWSSLESGPNRGGPNAWAFSFDYGTGRVYNKSTTYFVRAVRDLK
jgi:hypothetical protein